MIDANKLPLPPGSKQKGQNTVCVIDVDKDFDVEFSHLITVAFDLPPGLTREMWTLVEVTPKGKTSDDFKPSNDPNQCDSWKRVQIEEMKTEWDGGRVPKTQY